MVTVLTTRELCDLGFGRGDIIAALVCCLRKIRRGRFVLDHPCSEPHHQQLHEVHRAAGTPYPRMFGDIRDRSEQIRILIWSYAGDLIDGAVFSHVSAALIHGLDPPFPVTEKCETIRSGIRRVTPTMHTRDRRLKPGEVTVASGLSTTTLPRTLLDIASDYQLEFSVPLISEALRKGLVTKDTLVEALQPHRRGCRTAAQAISLADGKHESAGEAICAVKFVRYGITDMVPQVDTHDQAGDWIARNDFRHRKLSLIVEFHGVGKYFLGPAGPDQASKDNHTRHMKLLNAGFRVFNLVWADLFRPVEFHKIKATLDALQQSRAPGGGMR